MGDDVGASAAKTKTERYTDPAGELTFVESMDGCFKETVPKSRRVFNDRAVDAEIICPRKGVDCRPAQPV